MPVNPRTVHGYAALEPGLKVEPFEYEARPLGAKDIEVAISHCGICGSDLHTIEGGWGTSAFPVIVGHEIIGNVTAMGSSVTQFEIGERVGIGAMVFACLNKDSCESCAQNKDSYCSQRVMTYAGRYADGAASQGGYADYIRVLNDYAFKIPEELASDVAAPLLCAGVTVYSPLKKHVQAGQKAGVIGIGGLGHLALQFIRALGATPVAFSRSSNKEQEARDLGAEVFVNMSDDAAAAGAKRTVDVLIVTADAVGQPYDKYLSFLRVGGTVIMVGIPNDNIVFAPLSLIPAGLSLVGSLIGGVQDTKDMLELAAAKNVRPVIQKLPMASVNEGIQMVHNGQVRYRVVLEN